MKQTLVYTLLMPPGLVIILFILALVWWQQRKRGFILVAVGIAMLWVAAMPLTGRLMGSALIGAMPKGSYNYPTENDRIDAIVMLTRGAEITSHGVLPTRDTFRRAVVALDVQQQLGSRVPVIISGGYTLGANYPSEAQAAMDMVSKLRAQVTPVVLEDVSTNTFESPQQVIPMLRQRSAHNVLLITGELHMPRSLAVYRARGVDPQPLAVSELPRGRFKLHHLLPSAEGMYNNYKVFYEYYGLAQYLLLGRISFDNLSNGER